MKRWSVFAMLIVLAISTACNEDKTKTNTKTSSAKAFKANPDDYNKYLVNSNESFNAAKKQNDFWQNRLAVDSSGVGDLGPLAGAKNALFTATGDVSYLYEAEALTKKAASISANNKDAYERALAQNYISQHRFKEARDLLEKSYAGVSKKRDTEYQLFDTYMETGQYDKAYENLQKIDNPASFDYLIRISKWSDYRGDLDAAINYIEKAKTIAESSGNKALKIWTYTNLGDYYGHAGRIEDAYNMYLKSLELQPDNAYAKKGLAWIAFANDSNVDEANRILDSVMVHHKVPDYHLMKAEMATFENNAQRADKEEKLFIDKVLNGNYGAMYNAYLIEYYAENDPQKAVALAEKEIQNRATPETYHLLALAQLKAGQKEKALKTIQNNVEGKTEEPMALIHSAFVYKEHNLNDKVKEIKEELEGARFEIGPVLYNEVMSL